MTGKKYTVPGWIRFYDDDMAKTREMKRGVQVKVHTDICNTVCGYEPVDRGGMDGWMGLKKYRYADMQTQCRQHLIVYETCVLESNNIKNETLTADRQTDQNTDILISD